MSDVVKIGLVSISDRASGGIYEDKGIPALQDWLNRGQPFRRRSPLIADLFRGLVMPGLLMGTMAALILGEPDYGTTMLLATTGAAIMFVGGTRTGHLAIAGALAASGLALLIMENAERMRRITPSWIRSASPPMRPISCCSPRWPL